jgi:CRISPR system Cascade subunit CasA
MNLTGDPWMPVIYETGVHMLVSLNTLYADAEKIRDLCATPPQRIALMRLLICITQAALNGPEDERDWRTCRNHIGPMSTKYLQDHVEEFNLYGNRPFLQINALEATSNAVMDKLDFGLSAGNNSVLFDHGANPDGRSHTPGWCALMLLTYQAFSPGGTIGETKWSGISTGRNSEHAPCVEGSMLHTIIRGQNLLECIHLNLLTKKCVEEFTSFSWGRPTWEIEPKSRDEETLAELRTSYLGRLVPLSRGILLGTSDLKMTLVNGLAYPKLPEAREPSGTLRLRKAKKDERCFYLAADPAKHPWRELGSLLTFSSKDQPGGALALRHLDPTQQETIDVWTGGLVADQGKIIDAVEWTFSIPQSMLESSALKRYEDGVELAGKAERALSNGTKSYCEALKMENTLGSRAKTHFWSTLDSSYPILLKAANTSGAESAKLWFPVVRDTMNQAYEYACPHETPRQIQAFAEGQRQLRLKKPDQ